MAVVDKGDAYVTREGCPIYVANDAMLAAKRYFRDVDREAVSMVRLFADSYLARAGETDVAAKGFLPYLHDEVPDRVFMARKDATRWVVGAFEWRTAACKSAALSAVRAKVKRASGVSVPFPDALFGPFDGLSREALVALKTDTVRWVQAYPEDEQRPDVIERMTELDKHLSKVKATVASRKESELMATIHRMENRIALLEHRLGVTA